MIIDLTWLKECRKNRIHIQCSHCGRKQSNMPRHTGDPDDAKLIVTECDNCAIGKSEETFYYDIEGKEIPVFVP